MSGTRLHSPKAPATKVVPFPTLLLAAHGECGGRGDDEVVHRLARKIRRGRQFGRVEPCFVRGAPKIEDMPSQLAGESILVYPLFMSDGYYVNQAIPRALAMGESGESSEVKVLRPLGLNPGLPGVVERLCRQTAADARLPINDATLLLAAHGSAKSPQSRLATEAVAKRLAARSGFRAVHCAYLEEPPFLAHQLANLPGPLVVAGLFVGEGMHGAGDVPEAVAACGRSDVLLCTPLSRSPALERLILSDVKEAVN
ncbi:MAG: CbiX/SirB N-terminal domain-containing protein [Hyphomicrobiales bacterium]